MAKIILLLLFFSAAACANEDYKIKFGTLSEFKENGLVKFSFLEPQTDIFIDKYQHGGAYGLEVTPPNNKKYTLLITIMLPKPLGHDTLHLMASPKVITELKFPLTKHQGISVFPLLLARGDPKGRYAVKIKINNHILETVEFNAH